MKTERAMTANITVYGADWCRDCRRTKQYLAKNDIPHSWIDVEANADKIETVMRRMTDGDLI